MDTENPPLSEPGLDHSMVQPGSVALVAVTRAGAELARKLQRGLPGADIFLAGQIPGPDDASGHTWHGGSRELVRHLFAGYRALVIFGAVGMAVRLVGPLAADKHTDPAVVVVDDGGRFAVSLLSGHLGGANALARRVAALIGADPVITTASDALGTLAVDLLGQEFGWRLENREQVARVSAAVVNGEPVAVLQEAGEPGWWHHEGQLPPNMHPLFSLEELAKSEWRAALIITDRVLPGRDTLRLPCVVYRPRSLVAGIGCNRGTTADEIHTAVKAVFHTHGLSLTSLRKLATVDLKRGETGLHLFARSLGLPIQFFSGAELATVGHSPNPSAVVQRWVGTHGVCEPAAILGSGSRELVVPKVRSRNVTVAVARIDFGVARRG